MFSSRSVLSAGLCLALAASFVAGALLQPFGETPSGANGTSARTALNATEATSASGTDQHALSRIDRRDDPAPRLSPGAEVSPQQLAAIVTAVDDVQAELASARSIESGKFSITGSVATHSGMPLEGVVIRALPANLRYEVLEQELLRRDPRGAAEPRTMENALRQAAKRFRETARKELEAHTDAAGAFELKGLQSGLTYILEALKEGYSITDVDRSFWVTFDATTHMRLVARNLIRVPLRIETAEKELVDEAAVAMETASDNWTKPCYWERSRPEIWLPEGQYQIHAYQLANSARVTQEEALFVSEGTEVAEVVLSFPKRARIAGTIRGDILNAPERQTLSLRAIPYEDGEPLDEDYFAWNGTAGMLLNPTGTSPFQIEDIELGKCSIVVLLGSSRVIYRQELEIIEGLNQVDIEIKARPGERAIDVYVEDPMGRGVPELHLHAYTDGDDGHSSAEVLALDNTGARWRLLHTAGDLAKNKQWKLRAYAPAYGWQQLIEYDPRSEDLLRLSFKAAARLEVHLPQSKSAQLEITTSQTEADPTSTSWVAGSANFDKHDRARPDPLAPGRYRLLVSVAACDWLSIAVIAHDCDLISGDNQVTLSMPPLSSLRISVPERDSEEQLFSMSYPALGGTRENTRMSLGDADLVFDCLPAGHYVFETQNRKGKTTRKLEVDLPGPSELSFPRRVDAGIAQQGIELAAFDADARALQLGLQSSDVLLSIAGHSLRDPEVGTAILIAAPHVLPGDSFAVEVMRAGQRIELNLPRELFLDPALLGLKR